MNSYTLRTHGSSDIEKRTAYKLLSIVGAKIKDKKVIPKSDNDIEHIIFEFETNVDYQAIHLSELFENIIQNLFISSDELDVIFKSVKKTNHGVASRYDIENFNKIYSFQTEMKSDDSKIAEIFDRLNIEIESYSCEEDPDSSIGSVWHFTTTDDMLSSNVMRNKFKNMIERTPEFSDLSYVYKTLSKGSEPLNNFYFD